MAKAKRFCESCGKELEENASFCTGCGAKVGDKESLKEKKEETIEIKKEEAVEEKKEPVKKKRNKTAIIIASVVAVLVIGLIAFLIWFFVIRDDSSPFEKMLKEVANTTEKKVKEVKDKIEEDMKENQKKEQEKEEEKFNGFLYPINDDYGWITDINKSYYIINKKGEVISKVKYAYSPNDLIFYDGYSQLNDEIYNSKGSVVLSKKDGYESIKYTKKGFVVVEIKEEDYKDTTIKMGIYDLNKKTFNMEPVEGINRIEYLGEGMFLIDPNGRSELTTSVYNSETKKSFSIGDRFDVLFGEYKDGYIGFRDINSDEIYLLDKNGNKKLIYKDKKHVSIGQYNDGLIYIDDSFYDLEGNKVIDLKDEGVRGTPQFVNGYALIYFNTGYFTILDKSTKEYVFTPRKYIEIGRYHTGEYEIGVFEKQYKLSESGHLIVKIGNENVWAIMDHNGEITYKLPAGVNIFSQISDKGYIAVDGKEDYYITVNGKKIEIEK